MTATARFYYVAAGSIADPPARTLWANGREVTQNPFGRPYAIGNLALGAAASDADLSALGVYRLHETLRGDAPGPEYQPTTGALMVDALNGVITRTDGWREPIAEERLAFNRAQWSEQAQARKERDARKVLALPDSDDPAILKQKLNAALALLDVR